MNMKKYRTKNEAETKSFGEKIGKDLSGNEIICLTGDLGAGKTTFVKGIAKGVGINEIITSPTYMLVNEYYGINDIYHFDAYRVSDSDEFIEIGFFDYLGREGIKIIEWADIIEDIIPDNALWIEILKTDKNPDEREIKVLERK
jgi:tRNA threonylcarbamoyladenosine biosynthesis protein TsaE